MAEELTGVSGIGAAEDNGGGRHGGGCFAAEIRSGIARVNLVGPAVGCHILRPLPAVVVTVSISNLTQPTYQAINIQLFWVLCIKSTVSKWVSVQILNKLKTQNYTMLLILMIKKIF